MLSVHEVYRQGRGHSFQMYVTDTEISAFLLTELPATWAPYSIIGTYTEKVNAKQYRERFQEITPCDFLILRSHGIWAFWLRSLVLTPELDLAGIERLDAFLSLNGFVGLQQGRVNQGKREPTSVGIVDTVSNHVTGEIRRHEKSLRLFQSLKRILKKKCIHRSQWTWPNGRVERSKTPDVTEGFAAGLREGSIISKITLVE